MGEILVQSMWHIGRKVFQNPLIQTTYMSRDLNQNFSEPNKISCKAQLSRIWMHFFIIKTIFFGSDSSSLQILCNSICNVWSLAKFFVHYGLLSCIESLWSWSVEGEINWLDQPFEQAVQSDNAIIFSIMFLLLQWGKEIFKHKVSDLI